MVRSVAGNLPEQVKNNQSVNTAAGNGGQKMSQYSWFTVYSSSTEKEESTGRRIHLKLILDNGTESVNGFPHIGIAADNVDLLKSGDVT